MNSLSEHPAGYPPLFAPHEPIPEAWVKRYLEPFVRTLCRDSEDRWTQEYADRGWLLTDQRIGDEPV